MDFSKIIETLDDRGISFVSVTQQFNTANSMGRLTLNVLLSFAQFEREVTAERIRDKIATSKKKGMWMGGLAPLGYDAHEKKLVINEDEAALVRYIFTHYLDVRSVRKLKEEVDRQGFVTKSRKQGKRKTGGIPFSRGHLYQLLRNPIYAGKVRHKDKCYPGQHEAIIEERMWDATQQMLGEHAPARKSRTNIKQSNILTGLIFDETGDRLCPTYAKKGNRHYRYYISKRLVHEPGVKGKAWRLPADELEKTITQAILRFLNNERQWMISLNTSGIGPDEFQNLRAQITCIETQMKTGELSERRSTLQHLLQRITIQSGKIVMVLNGRWFADGGASYENCVEIRSPYELIIPFHTKRRGIESKIIIGGEKTTLISQDQNLISLFQRSNEWGQLLTEGSIDSITALAKRASMDASDITRYLPLAFLAPDIIELILTGRQPVDLNVERLKEGMPHSSGLECTTASTRIRLIAYNTIKLRKIM